MSEPVEADKELDEILYEYAKKVSKFPKGYGLASDKAKTAAELLAWRDKACVAARITALTDVDNLDLLNDSDAWHKFYMGEIAQLKNGAKDEQNTNGA